MKGDGSPTPDRARQLTLPLEEGAGDTELIVTDANRAAVDLLTDRARWAVPIIVLSGPLKSGRSLHARLAAQRLGAGIVDGAEARGELELFDLWNEAVRTSDPVVLVVDSASWIRAIRLPDLRSRLATCPMVHLGDPDDAMADALLDKLLSRRGVASGPSVRRDVLVELERTHLAIWRFADAVEGGRPLTRAGVRRARPVSLLAA